MKPLIKWPGGKEKLIKHLEEYLPIKFNNYIEPFLGSGALYFYLEPNNYSFLNDINQNLITFYRLIQQKNMKFINYLLDIAEIWDNLDEYLNIEAELLKIFHKFNEELIDLHTTYNIIKNIITANFNNIKHNFITQIEPDRFIVEIVNSIYNKFLTLKKRLYKLLISNSKIDLQEELIEQLKTAKRAGFYYYMRYLLNKKIPDNLELYIAIYVYVREYCFGSMFRFNKYGEFNIPYGGKAYNKKSFRKKVKYFLNPYLHDLLSRAKLFNLDFRDFFEKIEIQKNDFLFLDPPYLSKFKDYEKNTFAEKDHIDLANILKNLETQYMLILEYNETIDNIYQELNANKVLVNSKYTYSARGRNNKNVTYIILYNYTPKKNFLKQENLFIEI